jgi:hypothetical protein
MNIREIFARDLRGHAYIQARGLSPQVTKDRQHQCESCRQAEQLPAVQQLLKNWKQ